MVQPRPDDAPPRFVGSGPGGTLTEKDARALLAEQARSGLTLPDFARSKGLSPQRLFWWRTKFARQKAPPAPPTFVPVAVAPPPAARAAGTAAFELVLPHGGTVRIPPDFAPDALARLLRVLAEAR
jgi:hypothetical protein